MTREELKRHCEKQVESCEQWAKYAGEEPHGKVYEEHKLILELLEQEHCDDCVSREEAIDACNQSVNILEATDRIKDLPPVTPKQKIGRWIPVSERLPKAFEHCLWTTAEGDVIYHHWDGQISKYKAWMPLPKPYKAESEEK